MSREVVVVAAHPDDEVIGCAGSIARHVENGDNVHLIFMSTGVGSRLNDEKSADSSRAAQLKKSTEILGIASTTCLDLPDNKMDSITFLDVVQALEEPLEKMTPQIIYTHHAGDLNIDHRITHEAVITACRPLPGNSVQEILAFEVLSSTEWQSQGCTPFLPNIYMDISNYMQKKIAAVRAYSGEMRLPPHSRSEEHVLSLARHRGLSVGVEYAEAFSLVRKIQR